LNFFPVYEIIIIYSPAARTAIYAINKNIGPSPSEKYSRRVYQIPSAVDFQQIPEWQTSRGGNGQANVHTTIK